MPLSKTEAQTIRIGCAGWTVAKEHSQLFPTEGTHLERYATLFDAVEIKSADKQGPVWVVFDNTASGAAVSDGLFFQSFVR